MQTSTAKYYDIIYQDWIGPEQTESEVEFIQSLISAKAKILDIGCGTGRHLIPLSQAGYQVTGIEPSHDMVEVLKAKDENAIVISAYLNQANLESNAFDLAICMWNAIYEITQTESDLEAFLKEVYRVLKPGGKFIISTSDSDNFEPQTYDFVHRVKLEDKTYQLDWQLLDFDPYTNTTKAKEQISVFDKDQNLVEKTEAVISQRHWLQNELIETGDKVGFKVQVSKIPKSEEKYFIFQN